MSKLSNGDKCVSLNQSTIDVFRSVQVVTASLFLALASHWDEPFWRRNIDFVDEDVTNDVTDVFFSTCNEAFFNKSLRIDFSSD